MLIDLTRPQSTRRHVLGDAIAGLAGAMILAGAGVAMATPDAAEDPDAELIRLAHEHGRITAAHYKIRRDPEDEPFDSLVSQAADILDQMTEIRARSLAGIRAKALALATDDPAMFTGSEHAIIALDLAASLVADLIGLHEDDPAAIARLRAGTYTLDKVGGAA